jgi:hypothetical protein
MHNIHTNYQTSFRVEDTDDSNLYRIQLILLNWLTKKKREWFLEDVVKDFLFRGEWVSPANKHSKIETDTFLDGTNKAWAVRYSHADTQLGPRRFWYVDVGLHKVGNEVIVFIRNSYAWHAEDLGAEQEAPGTSVPKFISKILEGASLVYSGRREFRLIQKPAVFRNVGQGLALSQFITSMERRYPLIVINGDDEELMSEAGKLADELTGKCQVAVIGTNPELAEEIRHCLPRDYRIDYGKLRVFFPFSLRYNTVARHRWYDLRSAEYANQRPGILNGLLRNNALLEKECVESVDTIRQLVARSKFMALRDKSETQSTDMKSFFELFDQVEKERDEYKQQSDHFAREVDHLEEHVRQLTWKATELESRFETESAKTDDCTTSNLLPKLPTNLKDAVEAASRFYPNLEFTESAVDSASRANECDCIDEAWEIFGQLNNGLFRIKFETESVKDLEAEFGNISRYELAMSEGKNTKKDSRLMNIRQIGHNGTIYDITPHIKYGNKPPKMLRIHFAFDDARKKIVVGFVGSHLENATSRKVG